MKRCVQCGTWGRPDAFGIENNTVDGLTDRCLDCINAEVEPASDEVPSSVRITIEVSPAHAEMRRLLNSGALMRGTFAERRVAAARFEKLVKQARAEAST